ncbi:MAG: AhpC/TSA family protein [Caulobacteraceae bacterium]|nr:AhpC/TSA family protein [Caulobacteraceae bacterium]
MDGSLQVSPARPSGEDFRATLVPRRPVPALRVPVLGGGTWDLAEQRPERFSLLVFYRGFHCPVCTTYLRELDRLHAEFAPRGVEVFTLSSDTEERAAMARDRWGLPNLRIGYGLPIPVAREWGLYVSASRGKSSSGVEEPAVFSEPGVFVIRPDRTLYWASYQTMPFARPHFSEMLQAFDFIQKLDYPARGEL